eukprot:gene4336-6640_t
MAKDVTPTDLESLFSFQQQLSSFRATWMTIWTWELSAFAIAHLIAGCLAFLRLRHGMKYAWLLPIAFVVAGELICVVAGLITAFNTRFLLLPITYHKLVLNKCADVNALKYSVAILIAAIYERVEVKMTTTEAMVWGLGQFGLYLITILYWLLNHDHVSVIAFGYLLFRICVTALPLSCTSSTAITSHDICSCSATKIKQQLASGLAWAEAATDPYLVRKSSAGSAVQAVQAVQAAIDEKRAGAATQVKSCSVP